MSEIRPAGLPSMHRQQVATLPVTEHQHQSARGPVTVARSAGS